MHGLLQAENGEAMVELDAGNGSSGFKEGSHISLHTMDSCVESLNSETFNTSQEKASLSRHGTLLTTNATPSRNAAELRSVLGNSNARLKPGASIIPAGALSSVESTSLEQAKARARVEVDIVPETNIFVQGGYINGIIKTRIRPRSRSESAILISDGKIRVVGFECIQNEEKRYTFYQQSVSLSDASPSAEVLFDSPPDNEGFYAVKDGTHGLPFSMYLALEGGQGTPKGIHSPHAGIAIRYIVMISVKVKEIETDRRSIAHFYRDCEVWPRLNPSAILSPAAQPIRETAAKSLFMGGSGKVGLTATLHRIYWVAGQQCCVKVRIINKSKKTIKNLSLTLLRSTVAYKPNPSLDVEGSDEHDADACQTSTVQKQVAESVLEMGDRGHARGYASAKGWWAGVRPEETTEFCHFLLIPSDAVTIPRARLLEVAYNIRVTVNAGPLASNLHVVLPIRIINFLSIDPPPSFPRGDQSLELSGRTASSEIEEILDEDVYMPRTSYGRVLEPLLENDAADAEYEGDVYMETDDESMSGRNSQSSTSEDVNTQPRQLGNAMSRDDNDEFVQQAVTAAKIDVKYGECGGRFADLYYSSMPEDGLHEPCSDPPDTSTPRLPLQDESLLASPHSSISVSDSGSACHSRPARPRGPSSFAERVQQKLKAKDENEHSLTRLDHREARGAANAPASLASSKSFTASTQEQSARQRNLYDRKRDSSQEATVMTRQRSSTAGSYFRPREEIPDEVEILDEVEGEIPQSRSPFAEITRKASEMSISAATSSKLGSRVLPTPPLSSNMSGLPSRSTSSVLMRDVLDGMLSPSGSQYISETEHAPLGHVVTRARSHTLTTTPSYSDRLATGDRLSPKASTGGNSVKDRIKMLEEKARAEQH
ncbi:hypothetical protein F5878DRAFT_636975 [Lentinula raphanica]|uniref:Arrestin C-terminal-like domain-containing protein n=1 Tax=Lentinula raphanica TaxID=153919 RepID=A0AA38ULB7_9AGAR|nr:hypothetical protein F5878DRAFT_636975 [Lentinula raphanica]